MKTKAKAAIKNQRRPKRSTQIPMIGRTISIVRVKTAYMPPMAVAEKSRSSARIGNAKFRKINGAEPKKSAVK